MSRFFFYIFIFWAVMGVKGQEMAQNAKKKKMSVALHISGTIYLMIVIYSRLL